MKRRLPAFGVPQQNYVHYGVAVANQVEPKTLN